MPFLAPIVEGIVAIGAAVSSFVAGVGIIGQGIIMAGVGIAASYLISALTPKPQTDNSASTSAVGGVNFERDYGTNVSRQVGCGLFALAGHDVYVNTFADANARIQQIYVVSDFPCTALTAIWIGGTQVTLGADPGDGFLPVVSGGTFVNLIFVKFVDGRQTTSDARILTYANPADRWAAQNFGMGVSYVIVEMMYDQNNNNSFPDFFFQIKGAPLYDFRKDDTVGGSGAHRWGDVTTYEFSANPAVIEYNYRRGFSINNDPFCGMFMDVSDLPIDKFTMAANICDEVQSDSGPLYQCSILLDCMTTHSDNLQSIALSCGAMQIDSIDGSFPLVGSNQAVVATFTDEDIISTAQNFKRTEKQSMSTLVNSVSGNYPEPAQLWSMVGYDPQIASDFVVIDRRTRDINIDFPQVPSLRQADQLAWIYLYENRFETTSTVTLRPRFQVLETGDWVNWDSATYGPKTFIVTGASLLNLDSTDGPRNIVLTLQERDGSIYDGVTPVPIVLPFPVGDPVYASEVDDFALVAVSVVGAGGLAQGAIRVSWSPPADITITQVDIEYFPTNDAGSIIHKTVFADQTVVVCAEGIVSDTDYTVRAKIITTPPRTTTYNAGGSVHTLNILDMTSLANFDAALTYQVTNLLTKFDSRISDIEAIVTSTQANASGRQWNNKQMVQKQLLSVTGNLSASIMSVMTVATDTQTAFAEFQTTVTASIGDQTAAITENTTAIADINTGLVASWSLTLNVAGHISGLKELSDGTTAFFIIDTDVFQIASPAAFGGAAQTVFTLQTVNGVTQMALRGDFIADGVVTARSMNVGTLSAISGNMGVLTAGRILSPTGFTDFNLAGEYLIFSDNT